MPVLFVTGVGLVPHKTVGGAMRYVQKHNVLFLPELYKRGESMENIIAQADKPENAGKLLCTDRFKEIDHKVTKVQCVGPVTAMNFAANYTKEDALGRVTNYLIATLDGLKAEKVYVCLDEPILGASGLPFEKYFKEIFDGLDAIFGDKFKIVRTVHTCGNMNWGRLFASGIGAVSFDASMYGRMLLKDPGYSGFRKQGGKILWGVSLKRDIFDPYEGDGITATCGMGRSRPSDSNFKLDQLLSAREELI
jgi:hypothetical protein